MFSRILCSIRCVCFSLIAGVFVASATPPASDPVGALRLKLRGGSDTIVSLPLHRPTLIEATIASRSGNALTLSATLPSLPSEGAFALVMTGDLEGAVLPATSASDATVTVDATGYDLASLATAATDSEGDRIALIPYWTLDTVFPNGAGVHPSTSKLVAKTQILIYDSSTPGINYPASGVYFYFLGNSSLPAGWYRFGDMSAVRGNTRLPPHSSFVIRHPTSTVDTELLVAGNIQMAGYSVPVGTHSANLKQDNRVALPVPVPITLVDSRLYESGAFAASSSKLVAVDQLLVFDNTVVAQNKPAKAVYFYFGGNSSYAAGWYRFGDMQSAAAVMLNPGEGYIIRKHATPTPESLRWNSIPPYLQ